MKIRTDQGLFSVFSTIFACFLFVVFNGFLKVHAATPAIDLDGMGILTHTRVSDQDPNKWDSRIDAWIIVYDHDGISSDGSSHNVTVTFPDGTSVPLNFSSSYGDTSAGFEYWSYLKGEPFQAGDYTFTVTDAEGNVATAVDTLVVSPLPPPDANSFIPANNSVVADTTPTFTWSPVPGAVRYRVRIYSGDGSQTIWNGYVGAQTFYTVPPGVLLPNTKYRYRIDVYDAHSSFDVDNNSRSPTPNTNNFIFYTAVETEAPYIELDSNGVETWNTELNGAYYSFWIKVHDAQGVPGDIQSVYVTFPSGAKVMLYYDPGESANISTGGVYRAASFLPIETGTYTFTVEDKAGHVSSKTEALTNNPIGFPAKSSLKPIHNTVIGSTAVDFDWEDVPGAAFYRVEIYDTDYNRIYTFATTQSLYSLPAGYLEEQTLYRYRITTRREFFDENVDNGSASPWTSSLYPTLLTTPLIGGVSGPSTDPAPTEEPFGAAVLHFVNHSTGLSQYGLDFYIKVQDPDGVPANIKSVTVTFPDGTTTLELTYDEKVSPTEAKYWGMKIYDAASAIQNGTYTFTITDFDGNTAQATDDVTVDPVDIPSNLKPAPDSKVAGTTPVISWDAVPGAARYKVRIFDGWDDTVHWSGFLNGNSYAVPPGILDLDTTYSYRIYAYKEQSEVDNYSINPFYRTVAPHFSTLAGFPGSDPIELLLDITAKDAAGNPINPTTIAHEWLFIAFFIGGKDLGIYLFTDTGFKNIEQVQKSDPSFLSATYKFDHTKDMFSLGKVSLQNDLGMIPGDWIMYGYCYTFTDVNNVVIPNVVTLNM